MDDEIDSNIILVQNFQWYRGLVNTCSIQRASCSLCFQGSDFPSSNFSYAQEILTECLYWAATPEILVAFETFLKHFTLMYWQGKCSIVYHVSTSIKIFENIYAILFDCENDFITILKHWIFECLLARFKAMESFCNTCTLTKPNYV